MSRTLESMIPSVCSIELLKICRRTFQRLKMFTCSPAYMVSCYIKKVIAKFIERYTSGVKKEKNTSITTRKKVQTNFIAHLSESTIIDHKFYLRLLIVICQSPLHSTIMLYNWSLFN